MNRTTDPGDKSGPGYLARHGAATGADRRLCAHPRLRRHWERAHGWWNPIVFGAVIFVLALARVTGAYRESWLSYLNALIGVWLFVSAFWLADSSQASWNVGISGVVVFALGLWSATVSDERTAY